MIEAEISKAVLQRNAGHFEKAMQILLQLDSQHPGNPQVNYQIAWTHDSMGKESGAVPYYEKAIELGLSGDDLKGAMLGLGSTFRCLGEYEKSVEVLNRAVSAFPDESALKVFRALSLYNVGLHTEAMESLLTVLLDTTADEGIKSYDKALRYYSSRLDQVWDEA